jgi:hypothetical protein
MSLLLVRSIVSILRLLGAMVDLLAFALGKGRRAEVTAAAQSSKWPP